MDLLRHQTCEHLLYQLFVCFGLIHSYSNHLSSRHIYFFSPEFKNKNLDKLTCADVIVAYAISKHLKGRSVPRVSHVFGLTKDFVIFMFLDTFRIQGILSFLLFQDTFRIQGILLFLLFQDTFGKGWKIGRSEGSSKEGVLCFT